MYSAVAAGAVILAACLTYWNYRRRNLTRRRVNEEVRLIYESNEETEEGETETQTQERFKFQVS